MPKLPKEIRETTKDLDRERFEYRRLTKHWAIVEKGTGKVKMTLHTNGGHAARNQLATMRRAGLLREVR